MTMPTMPSRNRLVIVARADPVICGHSVEARNLAEAALDRGFDEVRIITWPIDLLQASGLNTLESQLALERDGMRELGRSADYREGVAAFLDKRTPRFIGA